MEKETLNLNDLQIMFSRIKQIHFRQSFLSAGRSARFCNKLN